MAQIKNEAAYRVALQRIDELLPLVNDETPTSDRNYIELDMLADLVEEYEEEHPGRHVCIVDSLSAGQVRIDHCCNKPAAEKLKQILLEEYADADIRIGETFGLCSFYAEQGGLLIGFERS